MSDIELQAIENKRNATIHRPPHYVRGGTECRFVARAMMNEATEYTDENGERHPIPLSAAGWWQQAFQYLWRWYAKGGIEDLEKAEQSIRFMVEELRAARKINNDL